MSEDRKYRQRGYREDDRDRDRPKAPAAPKPREERVGPRTPNLMGTHQVFRCGRCGRIQASTTVGLADRCPQCATDLHSCVQCDSFDPGATFECTQPIKARVSPKDAGTTCTLFAPRTTVERQTGSAPAAGPTSAKQAFDDLFKF